MREERGPQVGVGAVIVRDGRVALVQRGHPPEQGRWTVPGGKVRWGETLAEAVRREVREECGLAVSPVKVVWVGERMVHEHGQLRYHFVIVDYLCRYESGELRPGDDAAAVSWFAREALPTLPLTEGLLEVLLSSGAWDG